MTSPTLQPVVNLSLAAIRTDGGTQPRAQLNDGLIDEYTEAMRAGVVFPPVTVYYDGQDYWLTDGFHRLQAAGRCDQPTISAEVRQGTLAEAQWHSYSVNQSHGLRRTNDDKRRAVEAALRHPFAGRYSVREIAAHCGVSKSMVDLYRNASVQIGQIEPERTVTRNGSTYTMNTANIGRNGTPARNRTKPAAPPVSTDSQQAAGNAPALARTFASEVPAAPMLVAYDEQPEGLLPDQPTTRDVLTAFGFSDDGVPTITMPAQVREVGHLVKIINGDARCDYGIDGVHLVITSPPYNVGIEYGAHDDALADGDYSALLLAAFTNCHRAMVDGARIAVVVPFGVGRNPWQPLASRVQELLVRAGFALRGQIVWDKASTGNRTSWGSFRLPSDPCLRDTTEAIVVAHKSSPHLPLPTSVVLRDAKGSHTAWLANSDDFMAMAQDHWQIAPESAHRIGHPAPFPVALADRLIRFYGYPGCHVLDIFGGSGTVAVASARLNCRATLIEIDPTYCDLAAERCQEEAHRE